MSVITISREIGSEGAVVAQQLARALDYRLIDKTMLESVLKQFGFVQFARNYEASASYWDRMDESRLEMVATLNRVLKATASLDNVILLGRGAFVVLGGYANVLNVRLQAPLATRVQRVMDRRNLADRAKAEKIVKESDQVRASFIQSWYGVRWDIASYYNLVIDTSLVGSDMAVDWIVAAQKSVAQTTADSRRDLKSLVVDDLVVMRAVQEAFGSNGG
jgi:cytidylate kinase